MCDTMVAFNQLNNRSFFAKNSDREPKELQIVYLSINPKEEFKLYPYLEQNDKYINNSFRKLNLIFSKYQNPYKALISRPIWMWGAEMGVNEFGLAIGNEAVFSREKVLKDGLLGMDILRLALHNNKTAKEAVNFIIELIQNYGQGGDGGYKSTLKYHNSFLIKDFSEAYLLETSSNNYVLKKIDKTASISNSYTIRNDFTKTNIENKEFKSFKKNYESRFFTFFTNGDLRQNYTYNYINKKDLKLNDFKELLRSHNSKDQKSRNGTKSVCMHSGRLIKSETTSSMIVEYIGDKFVVWYTSSPHPCISLFKPIFFLDNDPRLIDVDNAIKNAKELTSIIKFLSNNYKIFEKSIKHIRDEYEHKLERVLYDGVDNNYSDDKTKNNDLLFNIETEYLNIVKEFANIEFS